MGIYKETKDVIKSFRITEKLDEEINECPLSIYEIFMIGWKYYNSNFYEFDYVYKENYQNIAKPIEMEENEMSNYEGIGKDWFSFKLIQDKRTGCDKPMRRYELEKQNIPLSELIRGCFYSYMASETYDNYPIKQIWLEFRGRDTSSAHAYGNSIHITLEKGETDIEYVRTLIEVIDKIPLELEFCIMWTDTKKVKSNKRRLISGTTRQNVLMRDNYTCQICGATVKDGAKLEIDHIIPHSKGGTNHENNLQVLCQQCNREKHNRTDLLHDKQKLAEIQGVLE